MAGSPGRLRPDLSDAVGFPALPAVRRTRAGRRPRDDDGDIPVAARGAHPAGVLARDHDHPGRGQHPARERRGLGQLPRLHTDLQPPRGRTCPEPDLDARPRTDLLPGPADHRGGRPQPPRHPRPALPQAGLRPRFARRARLGLAGQRVQRPRDRIPVTGLAAVRHRLVRRRHVPRRHVVHARRVPSIPAPAFDAARLGSATGVVLVVRADPLLVPHPADGRPARPGTVDRMAMGAPARPRNDDRVLPDAAADARLGRRDRQGDGQPDRKVLRRHLLRRVPVAPGHARAGHAIAAPADFPGSLHRVLRPRGGVGDRARDALVLLLRTSAAAPLLAP